MLFNSYEFVLLFLPITVSIYYLLGSSAYYRSDVFLLVCSSLFFYAWWNPPYLFLILASIIINYSFGILLSGKQINRNFPYRFPLLILGVTVNLGMLGYFKYANFFTSNITALFGNAFHLQTIILPLAISFFTFQQIAYLVDAYRNESKEYNFLDYCLFVSFFPQLIAGPIVHHKEMMPQFSNNNIYKFDHRKLAIGSTIFIFGLFKKVVIADGIAQYSTPVFDAALNGATLSFFEAWGGALAYTLQLYFDFSGYSDMAVGLAYLFGIRLALNFFSPYKAINIIDFWRRWHMTLSRFLRDYLYIPLSGSRKGTNRRYLNLMITMILGGLWHGAGWTYVLWGTLHGVFLVINHAWRRFRTLLGQDLNRSTWLGRSAAHIITFLAIVVSWVFFRAGSVPAAIAILEGMVGSNGMILPPSYYDYFNLSAGAGELLSSIGIEYENNVPYFFGFAQIAFSLVLFLLIWLASNTHQIMGKHAPAIYHNRLNNTNSATKYITWKPNAAWALLVAFLSTACLYKMDLTSEFLYFQF